MSKHQDLLKEFGYFSESARTVEAFMEQMVERLHATMTRYNWVGFYLLDQNAHVLMLGPHAGSFEPPERIPLGKGLCGAAAATGRAVVANDVAADSRYLTASDLVKSEIVAPVFVRKQLHGAFDVNSYFVNTFTPEEQAFIEGCAALVGAYMEKRA